VLSGEAGDGNTVIDVEDGVGVRLFPGFAEALLTELFCGGCIGGDDKHVTMRLAEDAVFVATEVEEVKTLFVGRGLPNQHARNWS